MITTAVSERKGNDCKPPKPEITLDRKGHRLLPHCNPSDSWVWGVSRLVRGLPNTLTLSGQNTASGLQRQEKGWEDRPWI